MIDEVFFGYFVSNELNMLIVHNRTVNRRPTLPGNASMGNTKLICKKEIIFVLAL